MPGEIQRYENRISGIGPTNPLPGVEGEWVRYTDHLAAVAAAVEERDRQWREHIESGRPLIFNHRGADTPAVTTGSGVNTNNEEDENLG